MDSHLTGCPHVKKKIMHSQRETLLVLQVKAGWTSWPVFRGCCKKTMHGVQQCDRLRGLRELSTSGEKRISISHLRFWGGKGHNHYWPKEMKAPKLNQHLIQRVYVLKRRVGKLEKVSEVDGASDRAFPTALPLTLTSWVIFGLKHCPWP